MASSPITSWEIDGETVETVSDFILGGSKITADGDCSHEIKRRLLLGRKIIRKLTVGFNSAEMGPETVCALGWSGSEANRAVKALLCGAETPPEAEPRPP